MMREQISLETLNFQDENSHRGGDVRLDEDRFDVSSPLIHNKPSVTWTDEHNPVHFGNGDGSHKPSRSLLHWPTGWKRGTTTSALIIFVIFIINVTVAAVCGAKLRGLGHDSLIAPLVTGDCNSVKRSGIAIHLAINVVSTLLLGASNYCMQSISAPTREDVDAAHAKYAWVDIGIPSIRNLTWIKRRRLIVWLLLGLTSVPLHLVYNSTFFVSTISNLYPVWYADESFAHGASFNETRFEQKGFVRADPSLVQKDLVAGGIYQNLTNDECIKSYAKSVLGDRGNLVLVIDRPQNCSIFQYGDLYKVSKSQDCGDTSKTSLYNMFKYSETFSPAPSPHLKNWFYWICSQVQDYSEGELADVCSDGGWKNQLGANPWAPGGATVKYCLSEKVNSQCQLNVALSLMYVVIAFNAAKLVLIATMATTSLINHNPLVTLGDAIDSFMSSPDPKTAGLCLVSTETFKYFRNGGTLLLTPLPHKLGRKRWASAVGKGRWTAAIGMSAVALITVISLLAMASYQLGTNFGRGSLSSLWNIGFGTLTPYNIIQSWGIPSQGDEAVVLTVMVTNLPQLLLSCIYLMFNAIVTSMTGAAEWSKYALGSPKGLRVSFPRGRQQSTFFLQLPYEFGIPMMALSALIHWLISQSFFIAQLVERELWTYKTANDPVDEGKYDTLTTAAFSPMAIILTCLAFMVVFVAVILLGLIRLKSSIPLVGSCSLGISAACHCPQGTSSQRDIKWGATSHGDLGRDDGVGHCSFSNEEVEPPREGRLYA